ncbi:MAG TPA: SDR family NAD(P)-dependent oxidoreductase [Acidimicrobiia bacterium]|nr:SDR family NAD(P)-dependent oxidoreductase [Acidimicrobiia bacterium]
MGRFDERVAVITGAASGIGKATARRFGAEGAIVACLDQNEIGAQATAREIHLASGRSAPFQCDVTDAATVDAVIGRVAAELGPPSVCCNVAGIGKFARSEEQPVLEFERIVQVNLVGTFSVSRACLPHLLANQGCIVNVSSSAGLFGQPYNAAYCASKGGVSLMTRAMAVEFSRRGVRVNAVAPAGIDTPITKDFAFVEGTDVREYQKMFPLTGKMAQPEEVATLIAFLASDDAGYISGAVVPIDMGVTA